METRKDKQKQIKYMRENKQAYLKNITETEFNKRIKELTKRDN